MVCTTMYYFTKIDESPGPDTRRQDSWLTVRCPRPWENASAAAIIGHDWCSETSNGSGWMARTHLTLLRLHFSDIQLFSEVRLVSGGATTLALATMHKIHKEALKNSSARYTAPRISAQECMTSVRHATPWNGRSEGRRAREGTAKAVSR